MTPERVDASDVTPKFVLVGLGNAWPAADGLGAGTPAFEWQARIAFATVARRAGAQGASRARPRPDPDLGHGTVRELRAARPREGERAGLGRGGARSPRRKRDGSHQHRPGQRRRVLLALAVGLAGRTTRSAGDTAGRDSKRRSGFTARVPDGYNSTLGSFQTASGPLWGGETEGRWKCGGWTALVHAEGMRGNLDVHRESQPDFANRDSSEAASFEALRVGGGYSWTRSDLFVTASIRAAEAAVRFARRARHRDGGFRQGLRPALGQRRDLSRSRLSIRLHSGDSRAAGRRARVGLRRP